MTLYCLHLILIYSRRLGAAVHVSLVFDTYSVPLYTGSLTALFTLFPCRQLILIIELYSHYDVYDYLRQIALTLCSDKVSEVRWISYKLVSVLHLDL